jgi:hypothetical protein
MLLHLEELILVRDLETSFLMSWHAPAVNSACLIVPLSFPMTALMLKMLV